MALEPPTLGTVAGADTESPHAATVAPIAFHLRVQQRDSSFRVNEQNRAFARVYSAGLSAP